MRGWAAVLLLGAIYGFVMGGGLVLLGVLPPFAGLLMGLIGGVLWATATVVIQGPLTRWRDQQAARHGDSWSTDPEKKEH